MKRLKILVIVFTLLISMVVEGISVETAAEQDAIRIGYVAESPFIKNVNGTWQGYGVEFLEKVSDYTNWNYRYVLLEPGSEEKALKDNVVDFIFLPSERQNSYEALIQSEFFVAYENTVLYAPKESSYYYEDVQAVNGKTVGVLEGSRHEENLRHYIDEQNVSCEIKTYKTHSQMYEAMKAGEVEIVSHGSLYKQEEIRVISRFNITEYYCFTSNSDAELMQMWNAAVKQLKYDDPGYEGILYDKFYGHSMVSQTPMFTREEMEYIAFSDPIEVKLMLGSAPLSYLGEGANPQGVFVDFIKLLEQKSGLQFDIQVISYPEDMEKLTEGLVSGDYIMLRTKSALEASKPEGELLRSIPLIETRLAYVKNADSLYETGRRDYTIAITEEMGYLEPLLTYYSKDFRVQYYNSTEACFDAVVDKKADVAIQDSYIVNYLLQKPIYAENLAECVGSEWTNEICVLAGSGNEMLINIINKSINHISSSEKEEIPAFEILNHPYQLTFMDILYKYQDVLLLILTLTVITLSIYTILIRRITKTRIEMKDYQNLQKKIQQDELTGLYNRPYFYRRAREMINTGKEEMCIVLVNIVSFQIVNDLYSMDTGDKLLKELADKLREICGERKIVVSRFTGDRFYMCMAMKEFYEISFPRQYTTGLVDLDIKLNYGVYPIGDAKDLSISVMCDRASIAAHNKEKNEMEFIRYYSEEEHALILEQQQIEAEMEPALKARQFAVFIQPKYDVETGRIVGGEALVRWKHPEKGMIPPFKFIGLFEKNGYIVRLDYYIWEETCRLISEWKANGIFKGPISVNVSRAHFYNKEMQDKLLELVAKYRLNPKDLQLEITESICAEDHGMIYHKIQSLRENGFEIAMDDFGSGYSSLNMLKEIPLDVIKMDLKFLDGGEDQERSRYILKSLIRLAQHMKLSVVVEGVETEEQVMFLKQLGNVYAQGYYYAKPIEACEYARMLEEAE